MALRNTPANNAPLFETEEDGIVEQASQDVAVAETSTETQVAVQAARPVAKPTAKSIVTQNVLSGSKDAFHIEWDSVPRISAEQGAFILKDDSGAELGETLVMELTSYQDRWVASPGDIDADIELVRWSDDGIESPDGTNLKEHVRDLIAQGWPKAKIAHRCVVVGELVSTAKGGDTLLEQLVQIDLPESGRKSFAAYQLQASWAVGKGRKTVEQARMLNLKAVKDKTKDGKSFTKIVFS